MLHIVGGVEEGTRADRALCTGAGDQHQDGETDPERNEIAREVQPDPILLPSGESDEGDSASEDEAPAGVEPAPNQ